MGNVLPLVGIAALMVFGLVVLMTALIYDPPHDRALVRERRRRQQRERLSRQAQQASSAVARAVAAVAATLTRLAIALAHQWWPHFCNKARHARVRWLTFESTSGQLIAIAALSVVMAYLIVWSSG
jgi:nitrate reductase NapE component